MAMKRVTAYYMHETERSAALPRFSDAEVTDSFVEGEVDEGDIPILKQHGLIVQEALPDAEDEVRRRRGVMERMRSSAAVASTALKHAIESLAGAQDFPAPVDYYEMRLRGPLVESRRQALDALGVSLLETRGRHAYKARLTPAQAASVQKLAFVERVKWISPDQSAPRYLQTAAPGDAAPAAGMLKFDIRLHRPEDRPTVEQWLKQRQVTIAGSSGRKIRIDALQDAAELIDLARLPEVDLVSEYVLPKLFNDAARRILAVDATTGAALAPILRQDGAGQIVAVADTGIDDQHPDFAGRIVGTIDRGGRGVTDDPHGHGTHVAGSVLGDGAASAGRLKGIAPKAKLFFQSLLDASGQLGGLPLDLNDLFDEAYKAGARIHNNSWGAATASTYTVSSEEVDEYIHAHRDMLVVVAAGNEGVSTNPIKAAPGFVDWLSIGSPASCKNALTVGASRSDRADGPFAGKTWGTAWPGDFPNPPIANETISGNPDCLAAFSSRGPCDDHRIKPDLVAPGTEIASAKSSLAPITNFWGPYQPAAGAPPHPRYAYDGGTSMATPLVSGCAALVRQYYLDDRHHAPSAALLKATLINSTVRLAGPDAIAPEPGEPNFHQGYGRVNMRLAIPNASQPGLELQFVDDWENVAKYFTRTGERRRWTFDLPAGTPELRLCLTYTDAPARGLQNNLNVLMHHQQSGRKWVGNEKLPAALTLPDPDNNVETIRIAQPQAGTYFIQVFAANLLKPPQDFALVVTAVGLPTLAEI